MAVAADELLGKGHVGGDAGELLQRVAADARVGALDAPVQVFSAAALPAAEGSTDAPSRRRIGADRVKNADSGEPGGGM